MTELMRPSPRHKTAALFITCLVDQLFPDIGIAVARAHSMADMIIWRFGLRHGGKGHA